MTLLAWLPPVSTHTAPAGVGAAAGHAEIYGYVPLRPILTVRCGLQGHLLALTETVDRAPYIKINLNHHASSVQGCTLR